MNEEHDCTLSPQDSCAGCEEIRNFEDRMQALGQSPLAKKVGELLTELNA